MVKRFVVSILEVACTTTHFITHHRPFLWLPIPLCWLALKSYELDKRWHTGQWTDFDFEEHLNDQS